MVDIIEKPTKEKELTKKDIAKQKVLDYLGNVDNKFLKWIELSTQVCGYASDHQLYQTFTPQERRAIEAQALKLRRDQYTRLMSSVDTGLLKSAIEGNPASVKLCYQRFEGWSEQMNLHQEQVIKIEVSFEGATKELVDEFMKSE
jgi:uncharacterized protein YfiM (DUF2279 family)